MKSVLLTGTKSALLTGTEGPSSAAPTRQASIEEAFAHFHPSTARLFYRIGALVCRRLGLDPWARAVPA